MNHMLDRHSYEWHSDANITVQEFIMLFDMLRGEEFAHVFDVTNYRIYKACQTVDESISS